MTFINYTGREINCKIVYYGPTQGGKVDNLKFIYAEASPEAKGKLISLATETDRTLFFDFLPHELGNVRGFKTRFHLYTVPVQPFYDASRKLIMKGVDGVVFVADSRPDRMEANLRCLENLSNDIPPDGYDLSTIPYVLQLNYRDQPDALSVEEMKAMLVIKNEPVLEAIATSGIGVFDTLKAVAKLILMDLTKTGKPSSKREADRESSSPVGVVCEPVVRTKWKDPKRGLPRPSRRARRRFRYLHKRWRSAS